MKWLHGSVQSNIHLHMLFPDGVYISSADRSRARFRQVTAQTSDELTELTHTTAQRAARYLVRQGLLVRDAGHRRWEEGGYPVFLLTRVVKKN